ncbi:hypothetical protein [Brevibacillus laterosporus]|uniref:hypothetical protein n=1 Tax=Brevibacillus laterosporus TaxID=1465 RepID=UPI0015E23EB9|nr:hypothetical protein [Brevibacillus laterosporus]
MSGVEIFLAVTIGIILLLKGVKLAQNILNMDEIDGFISIISFVSLLIWLAIRFK